MRRYIECNVNKGFGQPTLKGRRLTVFDIVTKIYLEQDVRESLNDYEITLAEAKDAVAYCMGLNCQSDDQLINFCDGCLLRTLQDGWDFRPSNYIEAKRGLNDKITISKDGKEIFLGSLQELEESEFGKVTWLLAEEVYNKLTNEKH